jgi:hypothetical protein
LAVFTFYTKIKSQQMEILEIKKQISEFEKLKAELTTAKTVFYAEHKDKIEFRKLIEDAVSKAPQDYKEFMQEFYKTNVNENYGKIAETYAQILTDIETVESNIKELQSDLKNASKVEFKGMETFKSYKNKEVKLPVFKGLGTFK